MALCVLHLGVGLQAEERLSILPPVVPMPLPSNVKILFGPQKDLEAAVVTALKQGRTEILVNQWAISSPPIAHALVDAFNNPKRRVFVGIILEENPAIVNYQGPEFFALNKIPFVFATAKGRNDLTYCVIDRRVVLTGYPWLASAVSNTSSLMVIDDPGVAAAFVTHWIEESANAKIPKAVFAKEP